MNLKRLISAAVLLAAPVLLAPTMASAANETGGRFAFIFTEGSALSARCETRISTYVTGATRNVGVDAQCFDANRSIVAGSIQEVDVRVTTKYDGIEKSQWVKAIAQTGSQFPGVVTSFPINHQLVSAQGRAIGSDGTVFGAYTMELSNDMRTASAFNRFSPVRAHLSVTEGDGTSVASVVNSKIEGNTGAETETVVDCYTGVTQTSKYTPVSTQRTASIACDQPAQKAGGAGILVKINGLFYQPISFQAS